MISASFARQSEIELQAVNPPNPLILLTSPNRAGGIRTHDLLNPIQAHYQAVLRPDDAGTIHSERGIANELFPVVIPSEVEGSRDVTLSLMSRDPSTSLRSAQDDRSGDSPRM